MICDLPQSDSSAMGCNDANGGRTNLVFEQIGDHVFDVCDSALLAFVMSTHLAPEGLDLMCGILRQWLIKQTDDIKCSSVRTTVGPKVDTLLAWSVRVSKV
jgi:hypothetical protein